MIFIIVPVISLLFIIIGKILLRKWFNHLTIYCLVWTVLILLYEWKLIPYVDITPLAWFYIASAFFAFFLGLLTITTARNVYLNDTSFFQKSDIELPIFADGGLSLKYSLLIFSLLTLILAIHHWLILINQFGSIPAVILNGSTIYRMSLRGEIKGALPYYLTSIGYVATFFGGVYSAFKGKITILSFLPFIGIVIRELANVGRVGMLFAILQFLFTFFLFRHLLSSDLPRRYRFSWKSALVTLSFILSFLIISSSLVRLVRAPTESFSGADRQLKQLRENIVFTPTLYFYLSSDLGVLSQYLKSNGDDTNFGENTFLQVHNILSRFGVIDKPNHLQKGYFIPMWSNTGTYIRELHADFGVLGVYLGPFLIGLFLTWLWFRFYTQKSLIAFTLLVYFFLIIGFSFLVMITRLPYWITSLIFIIIYLPFLEKISVFISSIQRKNKIGQN